MLRSLMDRCLLLAYVAHDRATLADFFLSPTGVPHDKVSRSRAEAKKKLERAAHSWMRGVESGLAVEDQGHLTAWWEMFHQEVHGSRLTMWIKHGESLKGTKLLSLAPMFSEPECTMYVNRFTEAAWMLHRLLPWLIQAPSRAERWESQWNLLDRVFNDSVTTIPKPMFAAFGRLMAARLDFLPSSSFPSRLV
jgi:hypothetical protein